MFLHRYKIVRHRVVWLLGNWVAVKMSTELRPSLYSVLVSVLQPCEDLVVRACKPPTLPLSQLGFVPRPHSETSITGLIPRPHFETSFPGLDPRPHSQVSVLPYCLLIPGLHTTDTMSGSTGLCRVHMSWEGTQTHTHTQHNHTYFISCSLAVGAARCG